MTIKRIELIHIAIPLRQPFKLSFGTIASFMTGHLDKVLLENRSSATPPPGAEMCSLALATGLVTNIDAVDEFIQQRPYGFWLEFAEAAERMPFDSCVQGVSVPTLAKRVVELAREGLKRRGNNEEQYLEELERRISIKQSPSEQMLAIRDADGIDAVVEKLRYRFDE